MSGVPIPDPAEELQKLAIQYTATVLSKHRNAEGIERVLRKMRKLADEAKPESSPCELCRLGGPGVGTVSEMVPIQASIDRMDEGAKADLKHRTAEYRRQRRSTNDASTPIPPCPAMVEGTCIFSGFAPLRCRNSPSDETLPEDVPILALDIGHATGLRLVGLNHHRVEVGIALNEMFEDPGWVDRFLAGSPVMRDAAVLIRGRDRIIELARSWGVSSEPSGFSKMEPPVDEALDIAEKDGLDAALARVPGNTTQQRLWSVRVPMTYRSGEDIDRWHRYFEERLDAVSTSKLDPWEAFDALKFHDCYGLPYSGRDVTNLLRKHGAGLVAPIVEKALPRLTEPIDPRKRSGRLRVGYLSSNLKYHNGGSWSLGWIRNHAEDIESFVFATTIYEDEVSQRFRDAADHYYHVPSDVSYIARFIKSLELDVLIFTDLGMDGANYQYAGLRLAPVQCTAWGHPVTSGLPSIDYYISSDLMEPPNALEHYTEKLVRLPGSGLFYERFPDWDRTMSAQDFGLPDPPFALMPQNPVKCAPKWDELFAKVSEAIGGPIAVISFPTDLVVRETQERMERAGVRTHWIPRVDPANFSRLLELSPVIIDPPAWSGGNSTLQAIHASRPVVTLPGEFMRGRHSAAFLKQAGMDSLIATDPDDYVRKVTDRDLLDSAVKNADPDAPFEDLAPVRALDDWLRSVSGRA